MKRFFVLGTIVSAGLITAIVVLTAQQPPLGTIQKVADNLYMIPGGGGNTAVFIAANGVVLVDTKLANNGQGILDQVKSVTAKPITHIINTHTHGDHTGSNEFFPANVEIIAQENTAANMARMPAFQDASKKFALPDRTYKDKMTVLNGRDAIDLYYFGRAHTNGDTFVVFRALRAMHGGDAFARKAAPLIDTGNGGSGVAYSETVAKALAGIRDVDTVITGHATVMKWPDFVEFGEFHRAFLDAARTAHRAGKTPQQAVAELKLPEKFKDYDMARAADDVMIIFGELSR
jgi:glyoxylase-like metal-dependent hydrolase (beta-lactamase superfamily II)